MRCCLPLQRSAIRRRIAAQEFLMPASRHQKLPNAKKIVSRRFFVQLKSLNSLQGRHGFPCGRTRAGSRPQHAVGARRGRNASTRRSGARPAAVPRNRHNGRIGAAGGSGSARCGPARDSGPHAGRARLCGGKRATGSIARSDVRLPYWRAKGVGAALCFHSHRHPGSSPSPGPTIIAACSGRLAGASNRPSGPGVGRSWRPSILA